MSSQHSDDEDKFSDVDEDEYNPGEWVTLYYFSY
jgi:hypothetical protein